MILSDLGADVVRIQRRGSLPRPDEVADQLSRGRTVVEADLKDENDRQTVMDLIPKADVVIEGFRPGVMERLGLGPEDIAAVNPKIVYGRMTGWGQVGHLAQSAGHDINFISVNGLLNAVGREGARPVPPLNLFGDFGGGSMFLVVGVLSALIEREKSGKGQTVDAAMVDGASVLGQMLWSLRGMGVWSDERGTNLLDSGAPFYDVYETADGKYFAVGAIEPPFYAELIRVLGLAEKLDQRSQMDSLTWPTMRAQFTQAFASRTRDEWAASFDGVDACATPVLDWTESSSNKHISERGTLLEIDGVVQAAPAPRFSRTVPSTPQPPARVAADPLQLWLDQ